MSTRFKSLIKGSLQVIFRKSDDEESQIAAKWEARKEISLKLSQMQYLVIDQNYDCDIYICDIRRFKSRRIELEKTDL